MLRAHHVVVRIFREPRVQPVARLARLAMSDAVRQHDEVTVGVEQLTSSEELPSKCLAEKARTASAGAMEDEDGVGDRPGPVPTRNTDRPVVQGQRRKRLAVAEFEVAR